MYSMKIKTHKRKKKIRTVLALLKLISYFHVNCRYIVEPGLLSKNHEMLVLVLVSL